MVAGFRTMAISARALKAAPVYLLGACVILVVYGFLFPVLNWPDEYRNVLLLHEGRESGYALIYGHFARLVVAVGHALFRVNDLTDVLGSVRQSGGFQMINGDLRYKVIAGVPSVYYFAKLSNLILSGLFAAAMLLYLARVGTQSESRDRDVRVFLLSLCFPSVAYSVMQLSTDILFLLFSLVPFFLRGRKSSIAFATAMALLVVEDRSFLLLSAFVLLKEIYGALLFQRIVTASWRRRLGWMVLFSAGSIAAAYLVSRLLSDPQFLNLFVPGLGNSVSLALEYTHGKSYNIVVSLVVFYAGFIILPSATELFAAMLPLYLVLLFVFYRFLVYCLSGSYGEAGTRAFIALLAVLTVFFFLTGVVHVFESGRYYLYLVPYVVHALLSGAIRVRGAGALKPEWVMQFGFVLIAVAVTALAYLPPSR
jgi:hypothetical protein